MVDWWSDEEGIEYFSIDADCKKTWLLWHISVKSSQIFFISWSIIIYFYSMQGSMTLNRVWKIPYFANKTESKSPLIERTGYAGNKVSSDQLLFSLEITRLFIRLYRHICRLESHAKAGIHQRPCFKNSSAWDWETNLRSIVLLIVTTNSDVYHTVLFGNNRTEPVMVWSKWAVDSRIELFSLQMFYCCYCSVTKSC